MLPNNDFYIMNALTKNIFNPGLVLAGGILFLISGSLAQNAPTPAMSAPTSPAVASSNSLAGMSEEIESLTRDVGQLRLQLEQMQQDNDKLRKEVLTQQDVNNLIENALAKNHADTVKALTVLGNDNAQALAESRKEIVAEFSKQIQELGTETDAQLKKLAKAIPSAPPPTPVGNNITPQKFGNGTPYKVIKGDNMAKIAKKYGVPASEIMAANHITDANKVVEGQTLFIPDKDGSTATSVTPVPAN